MSVFDKAGEDALVGLWFELGGGLGRFTGQIIGKAGGLYLIRKDGTEHFELMDLDDIRAARFYKSANQIKNRTGAVPASVSRAVDRELEAADTALPKAAFATPVTASVTIETPSIGPDVATDAPQDADTPPKRRLSDQIRRAVNRRSEG